MGNSNDRRDYSNSNDRSGEVSRLKAGTRGTIDELQQFLGEMRGKSPQEVMGIVAASGLTQGILWSTIGTALLLVVFTVVPFFFYGEDESKTAEAKKPSGAETTEKAEPASDEKADAKEQPADGDGKKAEVINSMTKELEETKGTKADDAPDIDDLLNK